MSHITTIRRATMNDVPELSKLFDLYRQFYLKPSDILGAERFLTDRIYEAQSVIFVATGELGELLGFTQLYPSFTSLGMARSWILNDLYVREAARGRGIARLLMNAATEHATATGARSINLETQLDNIPAQSLYKSLGYEPETEFLIYSKSV